MYGEGPSVAGSAPAGQFGGARDVRPYTARDVRFTKKGNTLYAPGVVAKVELLGHRGPAFTQDADALKVTFPADKPGDHAFALKISG